MAYETTKRLKIKKGENMDSLDEINGTYYNWRETLKPEQQINTDKRKIHDAGFKIQVNNILNLVSRIFSV